jgi:hypothetical protein
MSSNERADTAGEDDVDELKDRLVLGVGGRQGSNGKDEKDCRQAASKYEERRERSLRPDPQ